MLTVHIRGRSWTFMDESVDGQIHDLDGYLDGEGMFWDDFISSMDGYETVGQWWGSSWTR